MADHNPDPRPVNSRPADESPVGDVLVEAASDETAPVVGSTTAARASDGLEPVDGPAPGGSEPSAIAFGGDRGRLEIAQRAVERIVEITARRHPAVSRQAAVLGRGLPKAHAVVAGQRVRLQLETAVTWPHPLAETAADLRQAITSAVEDLTGLGVDRADVVITTVDASQVSMSTARSAGAVAAKSLGEVVAGTQAVAAVGGTRPEEAVVGEQPREAVAGTRPEETVAGEQAREAVAGTQAVGAVGGTRPAEAMAGTHREETVAAEQPREAVAAEQSREAVAGTRPEETVAGEQPREAVGAEQAGEAVAAKQPVAGAAAVWVGLVAAVGLILAGCVAVRELAVGVGLMDGSSWLTGAFGRTVEVEPAGWMLPVGVAAAVVGLLVLLLTYKRRRRTHHAVGPDGLVWLRSTDVARLASDSARQVDSVTAVSGKSKRKRVSLTVTTFGEPVRVSADVQAVVDNRLRNISPVPRTRIAVREE